MHVTFSSFHQLLCGFIRPQKNVISWDIRKQKVAAGHFGETPLLLEKMKVLVVRQGHPKLSTL